MANVTIKSDRYTVDPLYQWDINQELVIYGLSLATIPEIHFTNTGMDRAIVRQATTDNAGVIRADIPNSLLQKPYKITAYVCIYEGGTFKSLYAIEIPVKARTKPGDYTIETDEEVYSFNALENLINNTVVTLTADVEIKCDNLKSEVTAICNEALEKSEESLEIAEEASTIAKGKNRAHVFNTVDDLHTWLSQAKNAGLYQVGDNLYIVDTGVPDYWISEVLTSADADTGYYYKIAQLETQKVDLTNYLSKNDTVDSLSSTATDLPLSANQGRLLNNELMDLTNSFKDYDNEQFVGVLDNIQVYRKYVEININLSESSSLTLTKISHGIDNISRIVDWKLSLVNNGNSYIYSIPYYSGDGKCHTYISSINQSEIDIVNDINWNGYSLQGFIYYLKNS